MLRSKKIFLLLLVLYGYRVFADSGESVIESSLSGRIEHYEVTSVKADNTLNLRALANDKSKTVFKLPNNASGLLKLEATGNWLKLSYKNHIGWAYSKYLKKSVTPGVVSVIANEELHCTGTEPYWVLETHNHHLMYGMYDEGEAYVFNSAVVRLLPERDVWLLTAVHARKGERFLQIVVKRDKQCSDDMSDNRFNYAISVSDRDFGELSGCCNRR